MMVFFAVSAVAGVSVLLGKTSLAIGGMIANLAINGYPVFLQRYTRLRILALLSRR